MNSKMTSRRLESRLQHANAEVEPPARGKFGGQLKAVGDDPCLIWGLPRVANPGSSPHGGAAPRRGTVDAGLQTFGLRGG